MFQAIRRHFNATSLVAVIALVFAMTGGAYAAKRYILTSTKQISPSVLKALKGASGKAGAPGLAGPAGPAGPAGAGGTGPQGSAGAPGAKGENGAPGAPGPEGKEGKQGKEGKEGKTGFTETLPEGATETGTWLAPATTTKSENANISFPIPLPAAISEAHYVTVADVEGKTIPTGCSGTAEKPEAEEGNLCMFEGGLSSPVGGVDEEEPPLILKPGGGLSLGAGTTGAVILITSKDVESRFAGTWAVTG
jgi:hypothetical protein